VRRKGKAGSDGDLTVCLILDESGSMESIWDSTIKSVNEYISGLNGAVAEVIVAAFHSDLYGHPHLTEHRYTSSGAVPELNKESYRPQGGTPLYDALGHCLGKSLRGSPLIVIVTDGEENTSKEYKADQIKAIIKERTAAGWQFVYLGANHDAWGAADFIGVDWGSTYAYHATTTGMSSMVAAAAADTKAYANTGDWTGSNLARHSTQVLKDEKKKKEAKGWVKLDEQSTS